MSSRATPILRILVMGELRSIHDAFHFSPTDGSDNDLTYCLDAASNGPEGLAFVRHAAGEQRPYAVAFVDASTGGKLETVKQLWAIDRAVQVVICAASSDHAQSAITRTLGQSADFLVLRNPFESADVRQLARVLSQKWHLARADQARLEESVRRAETVQAAGERLAQVFDASPLPQCVQALDDGLVLEVNAAFETCFATTRAEAVGKVPVYFDDAIDPIRWGALMNRLVAGELVENWPVVHAVPGAAPRELRCHVRSVTIAGRPCAIWIIRDVTGHVQLDTPLPQTRKTEVVTMPVQASTPAPAATGPAVRVLAVEDDSVVQSMLRFILDQRGIASTIVPDGPTALSVWREQGPFDVLVTDMIMPNGLSGVQVASRLRQLEPALPVVIMTGYSTELLEKETRQIPGEAPRLVLKPFTVSSLVDAIRASCGDLAGASAG